jgi:hypothetical protein
MGYPGLRRSPRGLNKKHLLSRLAISPKPNNNMHLKKLKARYSTSLAKGLGEMSVLLTTYRRNSSSRESSMKEFL